MSSESDSFEYVQVLFGRAEDAIKRYERISLSVLTPAVNQLRYAGHHLIASVNAEDDEVKKFQLYKAARHCERAYYDSLECTLSELLGFFARFCQSGYTESSILKYLPEFTEWRVALRSSQRLLLDTRRIMTLSEDQIISLDSAIVYLTDKHLLLREVIAKLEEDRFMEMQQDAEQELEAKRIEIEIETRRENRRYWHSMAIAYASIVVGIASLIIAIVSVV